MFLGIPLVNSDISNKISCISRSCHEVTRYHVVNLVPHGKETFWRLEITSLSRHSSHKEKSLWYPRCESSSTRNVEIIWWEILVVAREFLFINSTKKLKDYFLDLSWSTISIKLCVHPPRGGLTVRKSCGTTRFTRPSYFVCTHHEEVSPWENLEGPRDLLIHHTICAPTTRRSHREKILWDHEIYPSIILCVHLPRGGLTVRKSCGTKRFARPSYFVCTHHEEISLWENLEGPRDLLVHHTICAPTTRRSHREKILWDHGVFSWSKDYFLGLS